MFVNPGKVKSFFLDKGRPKEKKCMKEELFLQQTMDFILYFIFSSFYFIFLFFVESQMLMSTFVLQLANSKTEYILWLSIAKLV